MPAMLTAGAVLAGFLARATTHAEETGQDVPRLTDRQGRVLTLHDWNIGTRRTGARRP